MGATNLFAFPGGKQGKRWHKMRDVDREGEDKGNYAIYGSTRLVAICKAFQVSSPSYDRYRFARKPRSSDDIILASENPPMPYCDHCRRADNRTVSR